MVSYAWIVLDMIKPPGDIQIMLFLQYSQFHLRKSVDKHEMVNIKGKTNVYKCHENNVTLQRQILNCVKIGQIKKS